jgi:glucokinase
MILGIDVGGSYIKHAVVTPQGTPLDEQRCETPNSPSGIIDTIKHCIAQRPRVTAVGIGMPGVVDATGCVHHPPNIAGWTSVPLQFLLHQELGIPVVVDNDANAAAMAEVRFGKPPSNTFIYVTLGTGVGGTIVVNGEVFRGATGGAGEIGHVIVRCDDTSTTTGHPWRAGTVEEYVGARALEAAAGCTIDVLAQHVHEEQPAALAIIDEAARVLAAGLASVMAVTGIPSLVIGGGIAQALPKLVHRCSSMLQSRALPSLAQSLCVAPATFGNHSGVIGAAALISPTSTS